MVIKISPKELFEILEMQRNLLDKMTEKKHLVHR